MRSETVPTGSPSMPSKPRSRKLARGRIRGCASSTPGRFPSGHSPVRRAEHRHQHAAAHCTSDMLGRDPRRPGAHQGAYAAGVPECPRARTAQLGLSGETPNPFWACMRRRLGSRPTASRKADGTRTSADESRVLRAYTIDSAFSDSRRDLKADCAGHAGGLHRAFGQRRQGASRPARLNVERTYIGGNLVTAAGHDGIALKEDPLPMRIALASDHAGLPTRRRSVRHWPPTAMR